MRMSRKAAIATVAAAAVIIPGAAWAAVTLFGFGDVSAAATDVKSLTITDVTLTAPLVPGVTVGSKGIVHNPNNFPVSVTAVITRQEGLAVSGAGCDAGTVHPVGTFAADQGTGVGAGWKQSITAVSVPANGAAWVEVPHAVSQDSGATAMCGFTAKIAVQASAGN
jgi:hypothetical protein